MHARRSGAGPDGAFGDFAVTEQDVTVEIPKYSINHAKENH